jgi:protein translocase SecG subunit
MSLLIGFLTFILVLNCLFLMLLILIQLPKKEAGAGVAFGGAATDALFGAGSGNALTKMTKYTGCLFVGMSVLLSVMNTHYARQGSRRLEQEISKQAGSSAAALPILPGSNVNAQVQATTPAASSNVSLTTVPSGVTNLMINTITNSAPKVSAPTPAAEAPVEPTPAAPAPAK